MKLYLKRVLRRMMNIVETGINYFKKQVDLHINYVHERIDGELIKNKDSFNIYICRFGKCHSLFSPITWSEVKKVLSTLESSKGKVLLTMRVGLGESSIMIPKWAKQPLIEKLKKELL
ncbi:hypothetical protein [Bacillus sp. T33-2]|uniref:hypothetical protein n=1 Tax=Bacillus sp. T33-2 TaxID=2054168 RepID=UPI000C7892EC|nr:hypothetical protein [Bacillus sp. T33-2]PLR99528.1 hypothetical protein CVD19_00260 [Bacillus sp. T33-2]